MDAYKVGDMVTVVDTSRFGKNGILAERFPFRGTVAETGFGPDDNQPWYVVEGWYVEHDMIDHQRTRERTAFAVLLELEGDEE